ncbi:MAG: nuclear transport factor 2 family protein [Verrucomicrobia bacterium]|nr:nuclear transport factor 2 family protein [Verrucomicrobiota bacterium]
MFNATVKLLRAGDWAGWAAQYAEDAVFQPPNGPAVRGRKDIRKWGDAFPPIEAFGFSNVQVSGEGNFAYGMSAYTLTLKGLPPDTGKQLVVFRRGTNGWQIVAVSFNSDLPLPAQTQ